MIVTAVHINPSPRFLTFGGSGGINIGSSCLDGPRVHRAGDSGWIKISVDSRATGAEKTRTVSCVPDGAWPGRSAVQLAAGKCTRLLQSEGQQPTGGQAVTVRGSEGKTNCTCEVDSQVILFDGRGPSEGRLPGSWRGGPWRHTEALVDSSTRKIRAWRVVTKASGASQARQSCAQTPRDFSLSRRPDISCVEDGRFSVYVTEDGRARQNTFVAGEGGRSVGSSLYIS